MKKLYLLLTSLAFLFIACQNKSSKENNVNYSYDLEIIDSLTIDYLGNLELQAINADENLFLFSDESHLLLFNRAGLIISEFDKPQDAPDAFGFTTLNGLPFDIDIRLNLRAFVLLKQEYPMVVPFIKQEPKTSYYRLKTSVNNPKPIIRFVLGLLDDVEIIGSVEFKDYLKKYVIATLENNKNDFENQVD